MPDYIDLALKGIIEDLFDHFMLYFLPEIFAGMDHSVPPEFLDKELETLFPDSEPHGRIADKLIKVRLTTGADFFILIHIEFQGYEDSAFAGRMFTYYYRIFDRYRKDFYKSCALINLPFGLAVYREVVPHAMFSSEHHTVEQFSGQRKSHMGGKI